MEEEGAEQQQQPRKEGSTQGQKQGKQKGTQTSNTALWGQQHQKEVRWKKRDPLASGTGGPRNKEEP
eukprot:5316609-Prorocentrum_lima.AAC.1